jgi:hypothetical protein
VTTFTIYNYAKETGIAQSLSTDYGLDDRDSIPERAKKRFPPLRHHVQTGPGA